MKKYNFIFKKNYGQNFLIDLHVLNKIIKSSQISKNDVVIEIGPGIGGLTEVLAQNAYKVIAIEIDKNLISVLEDTLSSFDNIKLINNDILKIDINKLIIEESEGKKVKIIANLPYYITTPIIMNVLESNTSIESMTVMVQKEVGERMMASPGTKSYGSLSLAVSYYADCVLVANVPQNSFMPRPNVSSVVIKLKILNNPRIKVENPDLMFRIIKAGFSQRRKTLSNCLSNALDLELTKNEAEELIRISGLSTNIRGEKLVLHDYARLTDSYIKLKA